MKRLILCAIFILLAVPASSAFVSEEIANASSAAFDNILVSQTDHFYAIFGLNNSESRTIMANAIIEPNNIIESPFIQSQKNFTAFWFIMFYLIFLFLGGIRLMHESTTDMGMGMEVESSWKNAYLTVAIGAPLIWAFHLHALDLLFLLEYVMSKSTFLQTMDLVSVDAYSNATGYFIFGMLKLYLILYMYIRYLILALITAFFLLIIAAWMFPSTRHYAEMLLSYFVLMLFSRFIMILIIYGGIGILQDGWLKYLTGPGGYIVVLGIAFLFGILCLLYPIIYLLFKSPIKYIRV